MYQTSLTRKTCKCGCGQFPTLGFEGYFYQHITDEVRERLESKFKKKKALARERGAIKDLAGGDDNKIMAKGFKSKSELLREADRVFANYIKRRDTDKDGRVFCPCCNGTFNATDMQFGLPVINCMHFIDRDVYLLRFDEDAAHAGHAWCNKNQHYAPYENEYQNFKKFLIGKFGETAVAEMELAKRKINRIEESQLKVIIEHYSTVNK